MTPTGKGSEIAERLDGRMQDTIAGKLLLRWVGFFQNRILDELSSPSDLSARYRRLEPIRRHLIISDLFTDQ